MNPQFDAPELPLVIVAGPTGSGKSTLAIDLAVRCRGEIVNCDSLQIYRGFDIGTAKTAPADRRDVPHHLFDVLAPHFRYSAGEYARQARNVLSEITSRGKVPIIAGGTGFYLRALICGLPVLPDRDDALRERLVGRERARPGSLHRILTRLDRPTALMIHANDVRKVMRALEIRLLTQSSRASARSTPRLSGYHIVKIGLDPDRAELNARLDARVEGMFRGGLLDEVRGLLQSGLTGSEKPFESLGYKQALAYLREETTLTEAIASTQLQTRQYAKRQRTWFRRESEVCWFEGFGDSQLVRDAAYKLISPVVSLPSK